MPWTKGLIPFLTAMFLALTIPALAQPVKKGAKLADLPAAAGEQVRPGDQFENEADRLQHSTECVSAVGEGLGKATSKHTDKEMKDEGTHGIA